MGSPKGLIFNQSHPDCSALWAAHLKDYGAHRKLVEHEVLTILKEVHENSTQQRWHLLKVTNGLWSVTLLITFCTK